MEGGLSTLFRGDNRKKYYLGLLLSFCEFTKL